MHSVCIRIHTYIHTYIRTYVHTYVHTYTYTYTHTHTYTYITTYIHTYICVYKYLFIYIRRPLLVRGHQAERQVKTRNVCMYLPAAPCEGPPGCEGYRISFQPLLEDLHSSYLQLSGLLVSGQGYAILCPCTASDVQYTGKWLWLDTAILAQGCL